MREIPDQSADNVFSGKKLWWMMLFVSMSAVTGSLFFRDWRVTSGLTLGCLLSFVNYYWAQAAISATFARNANAAQPKFSAIRYFFRYLIFTFIIGISYFFNLISVVAALLGLLTFLTAIFMTAIVQLFFVLFKRERT